MKKYELLLTLPGTLDDNQVQEELDKVTGLIKEYTQELKTKPLGKMRLAYPVRQIRYGYFYTVIFEVEPDKVQEISNKLRLNKVLLRSIINNYDPSTVVKAQSVLPVQPFRLDQTKEKMSLDDIMEDKKLPNNTTDSIREVQPKSDMDLNDIGKKLDEILDSDLVSGV
ncbi:MAG: 30S ribosomal protein S6 [bacterium]